MHRVLKLDEILLNIFAYFNPPYFNNSRRASPVGGVTNLVALARACRTFKEPALDMLWSELPDLSPLARCLPEASFETTPGSKLYSFSRPLEQAEWNTLRRYARRIRSILDFGKPDCVMTFLTSSTSESLFPNLRYLRCLVIKPTVPLLHQPFPSLVSLWYTITPGEDLSQKFQDSLDSAQKFSPSIRELAIAMLQPKVISHKGVSDHICRWSNLQIVDCPQTTLAMDALVHMSHMPNLTRLSFSVSATLPDEITPSDGPLLFWKLQKLKLSSVSLTPILNLLAHLKSPVISDFSVRVDGCPSKEDVAFFWAALQTSGIGNSVIGLELSQPFNPAVPLVGGTYSFMLTLDDLRPSMAFQNLRRMNFNIRWYVSLADNELLELASAWPYLEHFLINEDWGWDAFGGITPDGLVRLLQTCPSISRLTLAIDTRGYFEAPSPRSSASLGLGLSPSLAINVVDSIIEPMFVPAMAAFFATIMSSTRFSFSAWESRAFQWYLNKNAHAACWRIVYNEAVKDVSKLSKK